LFTAGFTKIAVSAKYVTGVIEKHRSQAFNNPSTGMVPPPLSSRYFRRATKRVHETAGLMREINGDPAVQRDLLRGHISDYRRTHGFSSSKDTASIRRAMKPTSTALKQKSAIRKYAPYAVAGSALIGAGIMAKKMFGNKKSPTEVEPVAQVENNSEVPPHLRNDPAYSLFMSAG